jgi:phage shock protein A
MEKPIDNGAAQFAADEIQHLEDRIKRLEKEFNELGSDAAELLNSNGELERRIKRLEEACRDMVSEEDTYMRLQTWLKAKESKP